MTTDAFQRAALAFYLSRPTVNDEATSALLGRPLCLFNRRHLAQLVTPHLARCYAVHTEATTRTVQVREGDPTTADRLPRAQLRAMVAELLLSLPDAPDAPRLRQNAIRDTRAVVRLGEHSHYLNELVADVAQRLPLLADLDPQPTIAGAADPADRVRQLHEAKARHRQKVRDAGEPERIFAAWWSQRHREACEPGAYPATQLYTRYGTDVAADRSTPRTPVGRNYFYKATDQVWGPRVRRANGWHYIRPVEVDTMNPEDRKQLARLVVAKLAEELRSDLHAGLADLAAETHAAEPTATPTGNVVDLASRRMMRAA